MPTSLLAKSAHAVRCNNMSTDATIGTENGKKGRAGGGSNGGCGRDHQRDCYYTHCGQCNHTVETCQDLRRKPPAHAANVVE